MSQPTSHTTLASLERADRIALGIIAGVIALSSVLALAGF